ncbi:MAG TPA: CaiB/BaiF CoA-transferase family protein, partial [Blastocatellia bacterium]|nr:CaiB/BaiF CoA-transferase family protein [Blastocatellia bacterium]
VAAFAILAALMARERTGRGQYVDVSMFDVMLSMLPIPAAHEFAGRAFGVGSKYALSGAYPFYNVYETSDGKYMTLGALEPKFWANFCRAVGRDDLIARQFDDGERRKELFDEVRRIFLSRTQAEWVELMRDADACCEPVLSLAEAFAHAQTRVREMVMEVEQAGINSLGPACKLRDTPPRMNLPTPALGQHTDEILAALGFSEAERKQLAEAGVTQTAKG